MNEDALWHQQPPRNLTDPEFWYESFQNWQSEILSIGALLVLGICLRQRAARHKHLEI